VAAEIGTPVIEWERLKPEVEEALGTWVVFHLRMTLLRSKL
jgi:hypothetical protein